MEAKIEYDRRPPVDPKRLWFAVGAGPILWAVHLFTVYALAGLSCSFPLFRFSVLGMAGVRVILLVITVIFTLIILYGGYLGYLSWQALRGNGAERQGINHPGDTRFLFMAFSGILLPVLFGAAVLFTIGPILALRVCPP